MRKSVWIFLLAVLIPSAVLGWLALRSAEEQKIILERQTTQLYQRETESVAAAARAVIDEQRRGFSEAVRALLEENKPEALAPDFASRLPGVWSRKAVGFSLAEDGRLLSPAARLAENQPAWGDFLREHGPFLGNKSTASVYNVQVEDLTQPEQMRRQKLAANGDNSIWSGYPSKVRGLAPTAPAEDKAVGLAGVQMKDVSKAVSIEKDAKPEPKSAPAKMAEEKRAALPKSTIGTKKAEKPAPVPAPAAAPPPAAPAAPAATTAALPGSGAFKSKPGLAGDVGDLSKPSDGADMEKAKQAPAPARKESLDAATRSRATTPAAATPMPTLALDALSPAPAEGLETSLGKIAPLSKVPANQAPASRSDQSISLGANSLRLVQPQQIAEPVERAAVSNVLPETTEFRQLSEGQNEGILARFVQDKLALIFWLRPAQAPKMIFGCVVESADLADLWAQIMPAAVGRETPEFVLALLNDRARPVATSSAVAGNRDWKRPFVASEIGEALPHWEAALYLMRPEQIQESALGLRRTLIFLVVAMLGAIALGGWLVVADARRQLALAQQKTDFVSNVSHELKTPLTSIRMFAELMLGGRTSGEKTPQYLRIIMVEAERLTRLINNVLDFAKLERRQKRFDRKPLDLHEVIARVWEGHELHLRESGFATKWEAAPPPYRVVGDEDALAQVLVNLLANAEKYCGESKAIELHSYLDHRQVCVSVLDRGLGVPAGSERKIFEAFYRAHDSLSSGIQGSGLGLTLAQRLAAEHGGSIEYRARDGGGSAFTLKLPLASEPA